MEVTTSLIGKTATVSLDGMKHTSPIVTLGTIIETRIVTPPAGQSGEPGQPYERVKIQTTDTGDGKPGEISAPLSQVKILDQNP